MDGKQHWEGIYGKNDSRHLSWYQEHALLSLEFIAKTGVSPDAALIDVGGGTSTLVDDLSARGFTDLTVLDISPRALQSAQARLGAAAQRVCWREADILQAEFPVNRFSVWHDRAVFHFLTDEKDRRRYVEQVLHAVKPGGYVIVATFAADGPSRCSGLEVVRYDSEGLHEQFGRRFLLLGSSQESHHTPLGMEQKFLYCFCRRG
jgi:SAM-dependent methyltransferase